MIGGLWVFFATIVFLMSLVSRQPPFLLIALVMYLTAAVSHLWRAQALRNVTYTRRLSQERAFWGEEISLQVQVTNRKLLPLAWIRIEDEVPSQLRLRNGHLSPSHKPLRAVLAVSISLRWYERVTRRYRIVCNTHGYHAFGPARLRTGDLFGFFQRESDVPQVDYLIVYPRVLPVRQLRVSAKQPLGDLRIRQSAFEDPQRVAGVREYVVGDSLRRMHWKASARTQKWQVKLLEPTTTLDLALFLNVSTTDPPWLGVIEDRFELAVTTTASLARVAIEEGFQVGIFANTNRLGSDQLVKVLPSRSPDHFASILDALAKVIAFETLSIERFLMQESRHIPWGATIVVITAIVSEKLLTALVRLQRLGRRVALVKVGAEPPPFSTKGLPYFRVVGEEQWHELEALELA